MKTILNKLIEGYTLDKEEAAEIMERIAFKKNTDDEISAFISLFLQRNLKLDELKGFYNTLMNLSIQPNLYTNEAIDVCGTGGDGKNTFNISTLSGFVIAGAGYKVIKHGNFGVSSNCGSSDLMQSVGFEFTSDSDKLNAQLEKSNITFLHAPLFHPALKNIASIRKNLGVKTFFNLMGPLINPAQPKFRMNGVFSLSLLKQYAYLYDQENINYSLVHTLGGYDEISLTDDYYQITNNGQQLIELHQINQSYITPEKLFGGNTIEESKEIFLKVLKNESTIEQKNVTLANAATGISCIAQCSYEEAFAKAKESIESLSAYDKFNTLIKL